MYWPWLPSNNKKPIPVLEQVFERLLVCAVPMCPIVLGKLTTVRSLGLASSAQLICHRPANRSARIRNFPHAKPQRTQRLKGEI